MNDCFDVRQGWAISGPRVTCGLPQRFQWPANAFRKNLRIWNFLQLSAEANVSETCFYYHKKVRPSAKHGLPKVTLSQINCPPLVYAPAEYCSLAWRQSTGTRNFDAELNKANVPSDLQTLHSHQQFQLALRWEPRNAPLFMHSRPFSLQIQQRHHMMRIVLFFFKRTVKLVLKNFGVVCCHEVEVDPVALLRFATKCQVPIYPCLTL